jgi:hypothetical protein
MKGGGGVRSQMKAKSVNTTPPLDINTDTAFRLGLAVTQTAFVGLPDCHKARSPCPCGGFVT